MAQAVRMAKAVRFSEDNLLLAASTTLSSPQGVKK
jgi:hypothetical protein